MIVTPQAIAGVLAMIEQRAASYGALRRAALTAIALDRAAETIRALTAARQLDDLDDLDTPASRLILVRAVFHAILGGTDPIALARVGLDFCDRTQAEREAMRGDGPDLAAGD